MYRQQPQVQHRAITNAIPTIWAARILEGFQRTNVWAGRATDVSGELAAGGKSLQLTEITSGVTVRDYARNKNINDPEIMSDGKETLDLDQEKYFNIAVDDLDRVQARPDLLNHFALQAARSIAKVADEFMKGIWVPGDLDASRKTTTPKLELTANDAKLQAFITAINTMVEKCDEEDWPEEGRWMVLGRRSAWGIREYLIRRGVIGTGAANNEALVNAAIGNFFGMETVVDKNQAVAAADGALHLTVGHSSGVYYAGQVAKVEPYRPEKRFADAVKGLYNYGAIKVNDNAVRTLVAG